MSNLRMNKVRGGDNNRLNIVTFDNVFVISADRMDAGVLPGLLQSGLAGIAKRCDLNLRTQSQPRKMVLQRNSAATDNSNTDGLHVTCSGWSKPRFFWMNSPPP